MRPADTWKDYELLDATDGNRLERWGETLLIRPDPQVVWKTPKQSPLWAKADAIYHRSNQGGGEWEYRRRLPEKWKIDVYKRQLVGATTRAGQITGPLSDRFGVLLKLELYSPDELSRIIMRSAGILDQPITPEGAYELAKCSRCLLYTSSRSFE